MDASPNLSSCSSVTQAERLDGEVPCGAPADEAQLGASDHCRPRKLPIRIEVSAGPPAKNCSDGLRFLSLHNSYFETFATPKAISIMGQKRSREQDGESNVPADKSVDKMEEDGSDAEVRRKPNGHSHGGTMG